MVLSAVQDAEADGWSQGSGATEDQLLYPLPRPERDADATAPPGPGDFTFSSQLRNLAVKIKLGEMNVASSAQKPRRQNQTS